MPVRVDPNNDVVDFALVVAFRLVGNGDCRYNTGQTLVEPPRYGSQARGLSVQTCKAACATHVWCEGFMLTNGHCHLYVAPSYYTSGQNLMVGKPYGFQERCLVYNEAGHNTIRAQTCGSHTYDGHMGPINAIAPNQPGLVCWARSTPTN